MSQTEGAVPRLRRLTESKGPGQGHPALLPAAVTVLEARVTEKGKKKNAADIEARIGKKTESVRGVPPAVGEANLQGGETPRVTGKEKEGAVGTGVGLETAGGAPVPLKATERPGVGVDQGRIRLGGVGGTGAPLVAQVQIDAARKGDSNSN